MIKRLQLSLKWKGKRRKYRTLKLVICINFVFFPQLRAFVLIFASLNFDWFFTYRQALWRKLRNLHSTIRTGLQIDEAEIIRTKKWYDCRHRITCDVPGCRENIFRNIVHYNVCSGVYFSVILHLSVVSF